MAFDGTNINDFTLKSNADLSAKQYHFVVVNSSSKVAAATLGVNVHGVLQNAPGAANYEAKVRPFGITKVTLGGSVTAGNGVVTDNNGAGVAAGSADAYNLGVALETGVSGDTITMLLQPIGLS